MNIQAAYWKNKLKKLSEKYADLILGKASFGLKGASLTAGAMSNLKIIPGIITLVFWVSISGASSVMAASNSATYLVAKHATTTPPGASSLCEKYRWACTRTGSQGITDSAALDLAQSVNSYVNRRIDQVADQAQYGQLEYWSLPSSRGGDCEDIVLLKKKKLLEKGLASESLLISTVLDLDRNSHAVLVLRTKQGDFVLDNLRNKIIPWRNTGYTFLKMQNPKSLHRWDAILAGGLIKDRPTGSK